MTAERESSKALEEPSAQPFRSTCSPEAAEYAVLSGIAALEVGRIADYVLLVETAKAAIQCRADFPTQPEPAPLRRPREFQRLLPLAPIFRDCFILRVLPGLNAHGAGLRLAIGDCRHDVNPDVLPTLEFSRLRGTALVCALRLWRGVCIDSQRLCGL
jgi:hypothetical protein